MSRAGSSGRRGLPSGTAVPAPADKRFRRSDVRPGRRRGGRELVWRIARWAVPIVALVAGGLWLSTAVLGASWLRVSRIIVRGNERLPAAQVEALVAGVVGENILQVDFEKYRLRVMDSPWIASVTLWRQLPSTIEVRVVERSPMAIARLGQQLYLVDDGGVIIDEYDARYRQFDLPIVDGLLRSPSSREPLADADRVRLTGALLQAIGRRPDLRARLSQIDVSRAHDAAVMFDNDAVWLHLGEERFLERLTAYLELAPTLRSRFTSIDYIDLRFDDRIFVRSGGEQAELARADK
jgi:cell division protein FtsQ